MPSPYVPRLSLPPDRTCAWIFTSGTSGKSARLTEITFGNVEAAVSGIGKLDFLRTGMTIHNPLSSSHVFSFVATLGFLTLRPRRVIFSDVQYLARLPESRTGKIDGMILVPIVVNRMRSGFYEKLTQPLDGKHLPPELRSLSRIPLAVRRCLKRACLMAEDATIRRETRGRCGPVGLAAIWVARRVFGRMFRTRLGSPGFIVVGGAKPSLQGMAFVEVLGVRCLQGWGMTETTGPLSVCRISDRYRGAFGTAGSLFEGTVARIEDGGELVVESPRSRGGTGSRTARSCRSVGPARLETSPRSTRRDASESSGRPRRGSRPRTASTTTPCRSRRRSSRSTSIETTSSSRSW